MKRAAEYSKMCDADVCVGIHLRETGQVFILSVDSSGFWAFLPWLAISMFSTVSLMKSRLICQELLLSSPKTNIRPGSGAYGYRYSGAACMKS
ncbi:unnamed protein product [Penicillium salamii]|nr:unnamed protein product [Penicillium salamii]CAG8359345.1 unnamed protein product [Penicillium salamii]